MIVTIYVRYWSITFHHLLVVCSSFSVMDIVYVPMGYTMNIREDTSHPNLAVCLTYVGIKNFSKVGAESVPYVCWSYPCSPGWRARDDLQQYNYCIFEL